MEWSIRPLNHPAYRQCLDPRSPALLALDDLYSFDSRGSAHCRCYGVRRTPKRYEYWNNLIGLTCNPGKKAESFLFIRDESLDRWSEDILLKMQDENTAFDLSLYLSVRPFSPFALFYRKPQSCGYLLFSQSGFLIIACFTFVSGT